ncbi:MAG: family 78 glycoside hydrolase catalytic domain, partial [Planifilum sp.]
MNVAYEGEPLESGKRYYWRVKVWDKHGSSSEWSEPVWWEMGLLNESDWQAEWIGVSDSDHLTLDGLKWIWYPEGNPAQGAPEAERYFRKTFHLPEDREITAGRLLLTADDGFVLYVNGERVASSPRVTDSWKEAMLVDVASALKPGANVFAIEAINDGSAAGLIGALQVDFQEGEPFYVHLDSTWKTAKDKQAGWEQPAFDDSDWVSALEVATYGDSPWGKNVSTPFSSASPYLRKDFTIDKPIKRARLYSTALGVYEPYINGERVGEDIFAPGWTDYHQRIQYQTYDVTELLQTGENAIGAMLGDGWYAGHVGLAGRHVYGEKPHLLMQLEIDYEDGTSETVATDGSWKWATGPIVSSDMLMGETYDARKEIPGWNAPDFDDADWSEVDVLEEGVSGELVAQAGPTVQVTEEIEPVEITEPEPGTYVFDLGQNMVGNVRLKVSGEAGETITLRHAEVLNPDGTIYTANLRSAKATDHYTLKGEGEEIYEPHFTFHGFRYVEVTGYSGEPTKDMITGRVMHTAAPFSGHFETSNDMLNQLQSNIRWGQRGNFLSIPTDTPARDERLGWTGDINVFVGAATFNMDVTRFLGSKWLQDLRDAQSENGAYPDVAPDVCCGEGNAGWGDAGVTVPYAIWQRYGDTRVIEENYEAMVRWIEYMKENSTDYIRPAPAYGDWLNVNDPTPGELISTAYFAYSTKLLSDMARAIGRTDDAEAFKQLFEDIKAAFNEAFVKEDGQIAGDSQTAYVLALYMDLLPEDKRQKAADHLVERIKERDWHLSTGFLGTRDLLPVLSDTGHLDVAYRLLLNDTFPSWGYQIKNGATTMWERWDSIRPDGSFQDAGMNSFNHYAYGAVGDWMYRNIAGIQHDPDRPGYKHVIIHPRPGGDLTHAKGVYESVYGTIVSDWEQRDGDFRLNVTVPVNTTATVYVPADNEWSVTESGQLAHEAEGVTFVKMEEGYAVYEIGSG